VDTLSSPLTNDAYMFFLIMSICHIVVVEKEFTVEIEENEDVDEDVDDYLTTKFSGGIASYFSPKKKKKEIRNG